MFTKKQETTQGMATEDLPVGLEIKEYSQKVQPGIESEMQTKPELTRLPTQHGHDEILKLEEYVGVNKLKGKRAIITGGDSGIGLSAAVMMSREGCRGIAIVFHPREQQDAERAQKLIEQQGTCDALLFPIDLASDNSEEECKKVVEKVASEWNGIDILVNNAAYQTVTDDITKVDASTLEITFRVNIFAMFYMCKYAVPHMPRGSSIINTTSVVAYQGSASLLEYSSTKGAIVSLTRSLSKQLAHVGIRVNSVAPGPVCYVL